METPYYSDILSKLVGRQKVIPYDELCLHRKDTQTFDDTMAWLIEQGYVEETFLNNKKGYRSTIKGNQLIINECKARRLRIEAEADPNSIMHIIDKLSTCWISVENMMPENATEMKFVPITAHCKFATVLAKDDNGHVGMVNRIYQEKTGNSYLDANCCEGWHWSQIDFVPTYWMPVPR